MNTSTSRAIAAVVASAAVITTVSIPATADVPQEPGDRPCFIVQARWSYAEGPQPTCPDGRFTSPRAGVADGVRVASGRVVDFMP